MRLIRRWTSGVLAPALLDQLAEAARLRAEEAGAGDDREPDHDQAVDDPVVEREHVARHEPDAGASRISEAGRNVRWPRNSVSFENTAIASRPVAAACGSRTAAS